MDIALNKPSLMRGRGGLYFKPTIGAEREQLRGGRINAIVGFAFYVPRTSTLHDTQISALVLLKISFLFFAKMSNGIGCRKLY